MLYRKLTLIGVGLLGGSLGMAVKHRGLAEVVCGYVRRRSSIQECIRAGAVDHATLDLESAVSDADVVVLCTPVGQMQQLAERFVSVLSPGAIVTDVGSVKDGLVQSLEKLVHSTKARFVGGHPMAGSEKAGVVNAHKDLFEGTVCVVTQTKETSKTALRRVRELWRGVGAQTIVMSPAAHDDLVSRSSHLPHILAAQLVHLVLGKGRKKHQETVCANGFRDTTRVASGLPEMWRDIIVANRHRIVRSISDYIAGLEKFRTALLENRVDEIERFLTRAKHWRDRWLAKKSCRS